MASSGQNTHKHSARVSAQGLCLSILAIQDVLPVSVESLGKGGPGDSNSPSFLGLLRR